MLIQMKKSHFFQHFLHEARLITHKFYEVKFSIKITHKKMIKNIQRLHNHRYISSALLK
jgi:hypothetical protein